AVTSPPLGSKQARSCLRTSSTSSSGRWGRTACPPITVRAVPFTSCHVFTRLPIALLVSIATALLFSFFFSACSCAIMSSCPDAIITSPASACKHGAPFLLMLLSYHIGEAFTHHL